MNLSNLSPSDKSRKNRKRRGRGPGSGLGKTAGRGHKGQLSGAGYSRKRGFEGGQMTLLRRIPKRGFTNIFRKDYQEVNLDQLDKIQKNEIQPSDLVAARLIKNDKDAIKVLGRGSLNSSKTIHAHKFSQSAQKKIEEGGGKAIIIG